MRIVLAISILFLFGFQSVKAESIWLVLAVHNGHGGVSLQKIQMENMAQCEEQGLFWKNSKRAYRGGPKYRGYECLKGK
tara:strand:- start:283 stop:519 length:237 start_codon:yes stop_codon:yes gene_type:complete